MPPSARRRIAPRRSVFGVIPKKQLPTVRIVC